jgi:ribosomal protein S18 acetylase RimI-like enzyme/predicted RNA-binding protein with PIN domain
MRTLYVDAMNVIGCRPDGWWRDRAGAVARLVEHVQILVRRTGEAVVLVVDGGPSSAVPEGRHGRVEVRYARRRGPDAADDLLVELLTAAAPPTREGPVAVVTADRRLRARVWALGAEVIGPRHLRDVLDAVVALHDAAEARRPVEVQVRWAVPERWREVRDLRLAALSDTPDAFASTHDAERAQPPTWWRERLAREESTTLVASVVVPDGPTVGAGLCVLAPVTDRPGTLGLFSVWVAPWARGTGAGDALLTAAIERARGRGAQELALDVGDHNAAASGLYGRHGFVASGRRTTLPPPRTHVTEHELVLDLQVASG